MEKPATASLPGDDAALGRNGEEIPEITATMGDNDAFMPPPAIDPRQTVEPAKRPDPFREADLINGGKAPPPRRKGPSLFQRMTGAAKSVKKEVEADQQKDAPVAEEPSIEPPKPDSPKPETSPAMRQTRLDDVTPAAAPQSTQSEEDLLDIPAFLRRQAN